MEFAIYSLTDFSRQLTLVVVLGMAWHASAAANIDRLGHDCGAGSQDACAQLVTIARTSGDGSLRRMAAERLIRERARDCPPAVPERPVLRQGQRVRLNSEYFYEHELNAARQLEIAQAGDRFAAGALRSLGLDAAGDKDSAQAVVELTVFGAARAWLFRKLVLDGAQANLDDSLGIVLYPDVAWKGVVTVRIAGRCVCSEVLKEEVSHRDTIWGSPRRKPSDAPFRRDLESSLAPVMIRLGKDFYGAAAIGRIARSADALKLRETALAQLRDQAALAEIAKADSSEHLRWAVQCAPGAPACARLQNR